MKHQLGQSILFILVLIVTGVREAQAVSPPKRSTHYDGSAKISYGSTLPFDSSVAMTIEAWVFREDAGRCETIVSRNYHQSYWLGFCDGRLRFYRSGGTYKDASSTVPAHQWSHVAASYDGTQVSFYIDGQPAGVETLSHAGASRVETLYLGGDLEGYDFLGNLDEVRIWMVARSQTEIQADMYREVTSAPGLALAVAKGGQAGIRTREEVFGVLPRGLVVPHVDWSVSVDGIIDPEAEYRGGEQLVIRYRDGANARDAVAHLVYREDALYIGVTGIRTPTTPWPWADSLIGINFDPNYSRESTVQTTDFRVRGWFNGDPGTWGWGNTLGDFRVTPLDPALLQMAYNYCRGEFDPPCIEFRIDRSLLGQWTETDGIAIGHYNVDATGHDYLAPADALHGSPATWTPMTYGDSATPTDRITVRGSVTEADDGTPLDGHRVLLKSGADVETAVVIDQWTTDGTGQFSFVNESIVRGQPIWVELERRSAYLSYAPPRLVTRHDTPTITENRIARYIRCSDVGIPCDLGEVHFKVRMPITPADVRVLAVEVSQVIQNHLNYPEDGPDGSAGMDVPLVPNKDLLVRFYVVGRTRAFTSFGGYMSTTIAPPGATVVPAESFYALNGAAGVNLEVDAAPSARARDVAHQAQLLRMRTDPNATLNFVIPAERLRGTVTVGLRVNGSEAHPPIQYRLSPPIDITLNFIRLINGARLGEPLTVDEILQFAPKVKQMYPASHVRTIISRDYNWDGDGDMEDLLDDLWCAFGGDRAPSVGPLRPYEIAPVIGVARDLPGIAGMAYVNGAPCADSPLRSGGTAISQLDLVALVHEIGHTMGFVHASNAHGESGGGDWEDWNAFFNPHAFMSGEPGYWGTFGANIQRLAPGAFSWTLMDPRPGALFPRVDPCRIPDPAMPGSTILLPDASIPHDLMSYGRSVGTAEWVSKVTYRRVFELLYRGRVAPGVHPASAAASSEPTAPEPTVEALLVGGVMKPNQGLKLLPAIRKRLPASLVGHFQPGPYTLELADATGNRILQTSFAMVRSQDGADSGRQMFYLALPAVAEVKRVTILQGNAIVLNRAATPHVPTVRVISPNGGEQLTEGRVQVRWEGQDADNDPLHYLVQYSPDGGQSWQGLNWIKPGQPHEAEIVVSQVIPGSRALVRVMASDGLNVTVDESDDVFAVGAPHQWDGPPQLHIDHQNSNVVLYWEGRRQSAVVQAATAVNGQWQDVARGLTTDGRNYAMVVPIAQQDRFFRLKMLPEQCFDLGGFPLGAVPNPWEVSGLKFVSHQADGAEAAEGRIVWEDLRVGYEIPYRLEIELSEPYDLVDLEVQQKSGLVDFEAYDASGALIDSNRVSGVIGTPQHVSLRALGTPIKRIFITAPNDRTQLLSLCGRAYPSEDAANANGGPTF